MRGRRSAKKAEKKFLTKRTKCGNLCESPARAADNPEDRRMREKKELEKSSKNLLTKVLKCVIIKFRRGARGVHLVN